MEVALTDLLGAAERRHDVLTAGVEKLRDREERDLARAIEEKSAISGSAWKERHALDLRRRAAAGVVSALTEILGGQPS